jgi:hypothetical protein
MAANAYSLDLVNDVYLDFIKIQTCEAMKNLRTLIKHIPKEYNIFEINEAKFMDNETKNGHFFNKNFVYFTDKKTPFTNFYIPTNLEILRLETVSDLDIVYHYFQYNPLNFVEDIVDNRFFVQIKEFFRSPTMTDNLENVKIKEFI